MRAKAGRLDLLLRDADGRRYEVELMLGTVDASHIMRTLEYWDIERKRYPQYDHCAVIVAEEINARFLNVIGLFNSHIPIIAVQMAAFEVGDHLTLTFVKVLSEIESAEDEEVDDEPPTDRQYWQGRVRESHLQLLDECFAAIRRVVPDVELGYRKHFIGLTCNGISNNFVFFPSLKTNPTASVKISDRDAWLSRLQDAGIDAVAGGSSRRRRIDVRLSSSLLSDPPQELLDLFRTSYQESSSSPDEE